jgi:hypothetical protein
MTVAPPQGLVLAIHPTVRGFGWAALEGPLAPYNGSLVEVSGDKNAACLRRIEQLFNRLQPDALVLEAFGRGKSSRSDRIRRLGRAVVALARLKGIEVVIYARSDVQTSFQLWGARTRREIAEAVARQLPALGRRLPPERKPWKCEDRRMALFASAALVLTYYDQLAREFLRECSGA